MWIASTKNRDFIRHLHFGKQHIRLPQHINSAHIFCESIHFHFPVFNVCTPLNTNYMFVCCILIHFRLICRSSVKRLCFGQRMSTTSFVLLNAPLSALDTEQHCGIGDRRKASRKNRKDDGECVGVCSPKSTICVHPSSYQWVFTSWWPPMSFIYFGALGMKLFCENNDDIVFYCEPVSSRWKAWAYAMLKETLANIWVNINENWAGYG